MDREALRRRLKSQLDRLVDELLDTAALPATIDEIEAAALRLREKAGQRVVQELGHTAEQAAQDKDDAPKKVSCSCARWAHRRGRRERALVTMAGSLRIRRSYYYCRLGDRGVCPADGALGVGSGPFTRRVAQEVVRLGALLPYGKAWTSWGS